LPREVYAAAAKEIRSGGVEALYRYFTREIRMGGFSIDSLPGQRTIQTEEMRARFLKPIQHAEKVGGAQ